MDHRFLLLACTAVILLLAALVSPTHAYNGPAALVRIGAVLPLTGS
jgi:hypothetical protein